MGASISLAFSAFTVWDQLQAVLVHYRGLQRRLLHFLRRTKPQRTLMYDAGPRAKYATQAGNSCWLGVLQIIAVTPPMHRYLVKARVLALRHDLYPQIDVLTALLSDIRAMNDKTRIDQRQRTEGANEPDKNQVTAYVPKSPRMTREPFTPGRYVQLLDELNMATRADRDDNVRDPVQHVEEMDNSMFQVVQKVHNVGANSEEAVQPLASPVGIAWSDGGCTSVLTLDSMPTIVEAMARWVQTAGQATCSLITTLPSVLVIALNRPADVHCMLRTIASTSLTLNPSMLSEQLAHNNPEYELMGAMWYAEHGQDYDMIGHYTVLSRTSALVTPPALPLKSNQMWLNKDQGRRTDQIASTPLAEGGWYRMLVYAKRSELNSGPQLVLTNGIIIPAGRLMLGQHAGDSTRGEQQSASSSSSSPTEENEWSGSTAWEVVKNRLKDHPSYLPQSGYLLDIRACATWLPPA